MLIAYFTNKSFSCWQMAGRLLYFCNNIVYECILLFFARCLASLPGDPYLLHRRS